MTRPDAPLRAVLRRPFPEQIAAFRLRLGNLVPTETWDQLWQDAHDRAFTVAGATQADLLADLALAVDRAISQGTGLEAFRAEFREIVARRGWTGWTGEGTASGMAWRTRVIYRTNMRTSYAAGRMAQLREAGFRYWIYRHGGSMEPRQAHLAIDGLILPSDHPFWDTWAPPNGWGCSCYIVGAHTLRSAQRRGGKPDVQLPEGWDDPAPEGIDPGWAYAPGGGVSDAITLAARKVATLPPEIATDYARSLDAVIDRAWPVWQDAARGGAVTDPGLIGTLDARLRAAAPDRADLSPGLVIAPDTARAVALPDDLPARLRNPVAVLVDRDTGDLVYVLADASGQPALELRVTPTEAGNRVGSAAPVDLATLVGRLASGILDLVIGALA